MLNKWKITWNSITLNFHIIIFKHVKMYNFDIFQCRDDLCSLQHFCECPPYLTQAHAPLYFTKHNYIQQYAIGRYLNLAHTPLYFTKHNYIQQYAIGRYLTQAHAPLYFTKLRLGQLGSCRLENWKFGKLPLGNIHLGSCHLETCTREVAAWESSQHLLFCLWNVAEFTRKCSGYSPVAQSKIFFSHNQKKKRRFSKFQCF